jgi:hypothetical protein
MFLPPALIVMTIVATRMYRSLIEFSDLGYYISSILPFCPYANCGRCLTCFTAFRTRRGRGANIESKMIFSAPIPLNRMEVTLHRTSDAYPPANVGQYVSYVTDNAESQTKDKTLVLSIGNDLENGVKTG